MGGLFPYALCILCCLCALCGSASASGEEIARLKARVEQLGAENKALRAEVTRLKDELYKVPGGKSDEARLATDVRRLAELQKALQKNPGDPKFREEAEELAKRVAPRHPGKLVWEVLRTTGVLKEGMSLKEAEKLLGPATAKSDREVEWYFNPNHRHVAPNLTASVTRAGLSGWKIDMR
jgi:predicted RNase H-like nuclease (RuvC/YqgF family)